MKKILVAEDEINFEKIDQNFKDLAVYSFDYNSHKSFSENKIAHKKIEELFDLEDIKKIEEFSLKLAMNWYKEKHIKEKITFEDLNLGSLIESELSSYFLQVVKRISGIKKILINEKPDRIFSYSLTKYLQNINKNKDLEIESLKNELDTKLFFDKISIPINIGLIKIQIQISRKNYFNIKKNIESMLYPILKIKLKLDDIKEKESILLIDFHTKMYKDLIQSFKDSKYNIIIFNQKKPVIWDIESLKIIKNSKCKTLTRFDFETNESKQVIEQEQKRMKINLEQLFANEELLNSIFVFEDQPFWDIIKDEFSKMIFERFTESIERVFLLKIMFEKIKIKHILDWAHVGTEEKEIWHFAMKKNIPRSCLQHGIMTLNPVFEKYHPIMPVLPTDETRMLVWGNLMKEYLIQHHVNLEKIKIVGSPRHDIYFKSNNVEKSQNILIATNLFFHHSFNGINTETFERYVTFLEKTLIYLKSNTTKNIIIKLHASEKFDIRTIIKKIIPEATIYQHEDLLTLMQSCESVISLNYSTILLDAIILNKPTLVVLPERQNFHEEDIIKQNAVMAVSELSELDINLKTFVDDHDVRNLLIKNGKRFVSNYFSYQGSSSKHLAEVLSE